MDTLSILNRRRYHNNNSYRLTLLRKYSKKKDSPKFLKQQFVKLKNLKEKEQRIQSEITNLQKSNEPINMTYKEVEKLRNKLRSQRWRVHNSIRQKEYDIVSIPIVPVIIPIKK